jgi:hypothetical protein
LFLDDTLPPTDQFVLDRRVFEKIVQGAAELLREALNQTTSCYEQIDRVLEVGNGGADDRGCTSRDRLYRIGAVQIAKAAANNDYICKSISPAEFADRVE